METKTNKVELDVVYHSDYANNRWVIDLNETEKNLLKKVEREIAITEPETAVFMTKGEMMMIKDCLKFTRERTEDEATDNLIIAAETKLQKEIESMDFIESLDKEEEPEEKKCKTCNGTGWIEYQDGCHTHKDDCPDCR